ncbi:MAG: universal stress protein [Methylocella sp.]
MTYATLMVHLEVGRSNAGLLKLTADLAEQFRASVIGIAARQPMQIIYADAYVSGSLIDWDRKEIEKEIKTAELEFRNALQSRVADLEWRSTVTIEPLTGYLAREARGADLVITGVDQGGSLFDPTKSVNISDFVMDAGRPVLVAPIAAEELKLDKAIIAWKDSCETRRAISSALPLLKKIAHVTVLEIASEEELDAARAGLKDVVGWLRRHNVMADSLAAPSTGDTAIQLAAIIEEQATDIVIAGAYGHSRLREWILGGVTRDLLLRPKRCSLISH